MCDIMSSTLWYLYEFVRKKRIISFTCAKTDIECTIPPKRYRKVPVIVEFPKKCISCSACKGACPAFAIELVHNEEYNKKIPVIDDGSCITCALCVESCPTGVLEIGSVREDVEGKDFSIPKYTNLIIDEELCVNCSLCKNTCPVEAISNNERTHYIIDSKCIQCMRCIDVCPVIDAIKTYDEQQLKEKIKLTYDLKFNRLNKINNIETTDNINNTNNEEMENKNKNTEKPRIVKSLCIKCYNCKDINLEGINLEEYCINYEKWNRKTLEVCPTTALRIGEVKKIGKIKDKCYVVDEDNCIGCRICYKVCEVENTIEISSETRMPYINPNLCVRCSLCYNECPVYAINLESTENVKKLYEHRKVNNEFKEIITNDLNELSLKYINSLSEIKKEMKKLNDKGT